jgi:hypothetical protein
VGGCRISAAVFLGDEEKITLEYKTFSPFPVLTREFYPGNDIHLGVSTALCKTHGAFLT